MLMEHFDSTHPKYERLLVFFLVQAARSIPKTTGKSIEKAKGTVHRRWSLIWVPASAMAQREMPGLTSPSAIVAAHGLELCLITIPEV